MNSTLYLFDKKLICDIVFIFNNFNINKKTYKFFTATLQFHFYFGVLYLRVYFNYCDFSYNTKYEPCQINRRAELTHNRQFASKRYYRKSMSSK